ncbi:MAG: Rab family GTPase [Candidatus Hermodarchaeota archaeon]
MAYTSTFKIVLFGDSQTGKTTLAHRFLTNLFKEDITMTLGVDFHLKPLEIDGEIIKLQIWDFAGEERFRFLFPSYIRGASGAVYMYDITNYGSLAHVDDWFEIVEKELDYRIPIIFVGGKTDLIHLKEVSTKKAMELAISKGADGFIECSSKTGENVHKIFNLLAQIILKSRNINDL